MNEPDPKLPALEPSVAALVRIGVVRAAPVLVGPASADLEQALDELAHSLAARHRGRTPAEIEGLAAARELYHAFGVDPTRTRPSSEALLRRVLAGKPLPRILSAVDVCNLCSLRFLLPIGLYDASKLSGSIVLRRGRAGESYAGIRKDAVGLEGRLVVCDEVGPFGNPSSDSLRTSVTEATRELLMIVFAPRSFSRERLASDLDFAKEAMMRFLAPPGDAVRAHAVVLS